jgi:hypothetical protein
MSTTVAPAPRAGASAEAGVRRASWPPARTAWLRYGSLALAASPASIAAWTLLAPRSFYDSFPGGGHHWVSALGAYDEHLVRDVGALDLGMTLLLVWAALSLAPALVRAALASFALASLPHLIFHLSERGTLGARDAVAGDLGIAVTVVAPLVLLALTREPRR